MRSRLVMGAFRYETFPEKRLIRGEYDFAAEAVRRIRRYVTTSNMEHLVDAANMLLLEFEFGNRIGRHFRSVDDGQHNQRVSELEKK